MNPKLLEQLALAKEAGANAQAKDFFAKPPSAAAAPDPTAQAGAAGAGPSPSDGSGGNGPMDDAGGGADQLSPEMLQELLQLLGNQGK